jgi:peptide/nickel transport system permease protein
MLTVGGGIIEGNYEIVGDQVEQVVAVTLITFGWMQYARLIRGNVLVEREKTYIKAAISIGSSPQWIIFRHLLPNVTQGLFVMIASDIGAMVAMMAAFSFLGFTGGFNVRPTADWGHMLSDSRDFIIGMPGNAFEYWYTFIPCSLAILCFSIGWNLIGDGFRDVLDPRFNGRKAIKTQN